VFSLYKITKLLISTKNLNTFNSYFVFYMNYFGGLKVLFFVKKKIQNRDYSYKIQYYGTLKLPLKFYKD